MFTNNQKGLALPLVLVVMLTASMLGVAVWQYSVTDAIQVARDIDRMQAYYLARSGADAMAEFIVKNPSRVTEMITKTATAMATGTLGGDKNFRVNVTGNPASLITITSEGSSGGVTERLMLDLTPLTASEVFSNVIFSRAALTVPQRVSVTGDLESAGNINVRSDYTYKITRNSTRVFEPPIIPDLPLSAHQDIDIANNEIRTIQGNFRYSTINMDSNATLRFDNQGGTQQVVVNSLTTKGNVSIIGDGRLELYITGSAELQTPLVVNHNNPNNLFIFLAEDANLTLLANARINAFIYGPTAAVGIQSAQSTVNGAIIANSIVLNNGNVFFRSIDHGIGSIPAIAGFRRSVWRD